MHFQKRIIATGLECIKLTFNLIVTGLVFFVSLALVTSFLAAMIWFDIVTGVNTEVDAWLREFSFLQLWGMTALALAFLALLCLVLYFVFKVVPISWKVKAQKTAVRLAAIINIWAVAINKRLAIVAPFADLFGKKIETISIFTFRLAFGVMGIASLWLSVEVFLHRMWIVGTSTLVVALLLLLLSFKGNTLSSWGNISCDFRNILRRFRRNNKPV